MKTACSRLAVGIASIGITLAGSGCGTMAELEEENIQLRSSLDTLEMRNAECRALTGKLEERIAALEKENLRLDERARQAASRAPQTGAGVPSRPQEPARQPDRTAPTREYAPPAGAGAYPPDPGAQRMAETPVSTEFLSRYQAALDDHHRRRFARSTDAFLQLLSTSPPNSMTDNCQFWVAENLAAQGSYRNAIGWYDVVASTPNSDKRPDAMLGRASALRRLNDDAGARAEYESVLREFPGTPQATVARKSLQELR